MARERVVASTKGDAEPTSPEWRVLGYLAPWIGVTAGVPVGILAHLFFAEEPKEMGVAAAVTAVAGVALTYTAWTAGRARGPQVRAFATAFTAAECTWVLTCEIFGITAKPVWGTLFGMVVFVAAHNIMRALRGKGDDEQQNGGTLAQKIREAGRQIKNPRVDPATGIVEARVIANRAEETIDDVQKTLPAQIESMEGLPPGAATVIASPSDRGAGTLRVVPGQPLKESPRWPGVAAPGKSIALPIQVGLYVDRRPEQLWLPGDPTIGRNLSHIKLMGVNGAGKSEAMKIVATEAETRIDAVIFASDHVKGLQTFGPLIEYMTWSVINPGDDPIGSRKRSLAMLRAVRNLVSCNANMMGKAGFKQWTPEVFTKLGIPLTIVWIEEASEITGDSESFVRLAQQARSAGILLVWSAQRATWTNVETDARSQLTTEWCFGVNDEADNKFGLPETVVDAGAAPHVWANRKPGMNYLVAPGIDEDRWPMQARTFWVPDDDVFASELATYAVRTELHEEGVRALGEAFAKRQRFTATPGTLLVPGEVTPATAAAVDDDTADDDEEDGDVKEPLVSAEAPELQVNSSEPIGDPEVKMSFGVPTQGAKLSTAQAKAVVQHHLRELMDAGVMQTQAADIFKMKPATTRSHEWVRKELIRLCESPQEGEVALVRDDEDDIGVFRIDSIVGGAATRVLAAVP